MNRLVFANQLRGLAALSVAFSHLAGVYWSMRDVASAATFSPVQPGPEPALLAVTHFAWFNFGPFGVAVFFLISGLVIPISLERHTRWTFLLARLLRIYPTYLAALALELVVVGVASLYWDKPFSYSLWTIVSNGLLIYDLFGQPCLDLVSWTLCIELKFYVLAMALAPLIRRGHVMPLFAVAVAIVLGTLALQHGPSFIAARSIAKALELESSYLVFMLIGVLFYFRLSGRLGLPGLLAGVVTMVALFLACWYAGAPDIQFIVVAVNYLYAVALFGVLFALRRFARRLPILDGLAAISFPFYLVHSLIGYSVMKVLMLSGGLGYLPALGIAVAVIVAVSSVLHVTVETWSVDLGRGLSRRPRMPAPTLVPSGIASGS